jgi:hypothetical protein
MQTTPQQQVEATKLIPQLKRFSKFLINIATTTYKFGQDTNIFIKRVMEQSKTIEILQNQNQEIDDLKKKVLSMEVESTKVAELEAKLLKFQGKIVLLERGRNLSRFQRF